MASHTREPDDDIIVKRLAATMPTVVTAVIVPAAVISTVVRITVSSAAEAKDNTGPAVVSRIIVSGVGIVSAVISPVGVVIRTRRYPDTYSKRHVRRFGPGCPRNQQHCRRYRQVQNTSLLHCLRPSFQEWSMLTFASLNTYPRPRPCKRSLNGGACPAAPGT